MAGRDQGEARATPETTEITVDLSEANPDKAVQRQRRPLQTDQARAARGDEEDDKPKTRAERELFKRMGRFQRNIQKEFNQKLADQEARHQRETSDLRKQLERGGLDRSDDSVAATAHDNAIKALEAKLSAAIERGDSAEQARLTVEITRLDGAYHAKLAGTQQRRDTDPGKATEEARPAPKAQGPTAAGARFITMNEEWWEDPEFEIEKAAAGNLYVALINEEGFEANSDETFREVAKRLKAKFPKLDVKSKGAKAGEDDPDDPEADPPAREEPHRRRPAMAAFQDRGGQGNQGDKRTLTAVDIKTMQDSRLDPNNNAHVLAYLREANAYEERAR